MASLWRDLLKVEHLYRDSHFFRMGGDSLLATRLIGELNRRGFSAALGDLFDFPTLAAFAETVRSGDTIGTPGLRHDPTRRYAPFPLTDVQQAYLVGRQPGFALGGIGSHFFVEFEVADLDVARFERAMNRLISRHDTLRAVVRDGMQQVLPQVPDFRLPCHPVTDLDAPEAVALRERLARQVLDPSRWPVFDIQAALVDGGAKASLFVCLDNLMLDGLSMQILLAELEQLYTNPGQSLPELEIGFRDYLEHVQQRPANDVSLAYWARRLDHLPPAPRLPLRCDPGDVGLPRFARLSARLAAPQWEALKARARAEGLTPSALLLSAYAATLSAWAGHDELSLNSPCSTASRCTRRSNRYWATSRRCCCWLGNRPRTGAAAPRACSNACARTCCIAMSRPFKSCANWPGALDKRLPPCPWCSPAPWASNRTASSPMRPG